MKDLIVYSKKDIFHYGVLGMHWGIRRYQPYPKGHKGGKEVGEAAKKMSFSKVEKTKKDFEGFSSTKYSVRDADGNIVSKANVYDFNMSGFDWLLLADVETSKKHRGKGLATSVLKDVMNDTSNKDKGLYLMVKQDNEAAINLYKKMNFKTAKSYTIDNKDYFVMATGNGNLKKLKSMNFS